ncbi:MAG: response regulator [Chloroflexi bacterium]|nr:response regulator [Chloroflexota bacterium]
MADGKEALQRFRAGDFDLVITDRTMPGMSGDQVAAAIKRAAPGTPVILLTGYGDLMAASGEQPPGVDLILAKPLTMSALRQAIARLTAGRGSATGD